MSKTVAVVLTTPTHDLDSPHHCRRAIARYADLAVSYHASMPVRSWTGNGGCANQPHCKQHTVLHNHRQQHSRNDDSREHAEWNGHIAEINQIKTSIHGIGRTTLSTALSTVSTVMLMHHQHGRDEVCRHGRRHHVCDECVHLKQS